MRRKNMMVAVFLSALTLGACVDNEESASVTEVRSAKAAQLNALATKAKAEAEATLILANAEKAYKDAQVNYENAKAEALKQETTEAAFALQKAKEEYERNLEAIKKEAEARLWKAKQDAAEAEQRFLAMADVKLKALYSAYSEETAKLASYQNRLDENKYYLTKYQANLIAVDEYIAIQLADKQSEISKKTSEIEAWKTYSGVDRAKLEADLLSLQQDKYAAFATLNAATIAMDAASNAFSNAEKMINVYSSEESSLKTIAAVQQLIDMGMDDKGFIYLNSKKIQLLKVEYKKLLESSKMIIPYYTWNGTHGAEALTQWATQKYDAEVKSLGVPATADFEATGLYWSLDYAEKSKTTAEKSLKTAQTNLTKAQADLTAGNKDKAAADTEKKKAEADIKAAQAAKKAADVELTAAEKEFAAADTEAKKLLAAAKVVAAEGKIKEAVKKESDAVVIVDKATIAFDAADKKVNTAKQSISDLGSEIEYTNRQISEAVLDIKTANDKIAVQNVRIADAKKMKDNAPVIIAAFSGKDKEAYDAAIKALEAGAGTDYAKALLAYDNANESSYDISAKIYSITVLLNNSQVANAKEKISSLEAEIVKIKKEILDLRSEDLQGGSAESIEKMINKANAEIAALTAQIEIQKALVDLAKKALDAALGGK